MDTQDREITIERVGSESRASLSAMVDEYLAELHRHRERPIGATAAKDYRYLPLYWSEPGRHPFFFRSADQRRCFICSCIDSAFSASASGIRPFCWYSIDRLVWASGSSGSRAT